MSSLGPSITPGRIAFRLSPRLRRATLTAHIAASVGLLGDVAAVLAVHVRAATTEDPALARAAYELLEMFSLVFGIPLSLVALATGTVLGLGSRWGLVRHLWVAAKLGLLLSVVVVGAVVLGPGTAAARAGEAGREPVLILAAGYDVLALALATALSVYEPGRSRRPAAQR